MKNRVLVLAIWFCMAFWPVLLWGQGAGPAAAPGKVGVIGMQEAILNTAQGKKGMAELQRKYQPRQQDLQRQQQEIQALTEQLQKQQATLSDEESRRLNRDLEEKQKLFKRASEDFNADAAADRDEMMRRILQKMAPLVSDYAQQNGYSLVVDGAQMPIYFAARDIDLTEEMVKRYDAANPVDTGATPGGTAPPPAATRPAAPAPKPAAAPVKPAEKPKP
jgi:outer membrane protein